MTRRGSNGAPEQGDAGISDDRPAGLLTASEPRER